MTMVEMVGMVGAGKTTLASALRGDLETRGFTVLHLETAIGEVLGRSLLGSVSRRLVRSPASRRRVLRATYKLAVRPWHMLRFVARHPGLSWSAVEAVRRSPLPVWHRRKILSLFLRPAAAQLYFGPRLRAKEILLLEEGLVHRAVNLFAWSAGEVDRTTVAKYVAKLPPTDLAVLVAAPLSVCIGRAGSRGLPRRLMGRDEETIARFMNNAAEIIDGIPEFLGEASRPWIVVDNGGTPAAAVASLREAIDAHLAAAPAPDGHARTKAVAGSPHAGSPQTGRP